MGEESSSSVAPSDIDGNIFLVGLMGAGKTSVAKILARRLGKTFYDSDHEVERSTGVRIPVIFEIEGEAGFRMPAAEGADQQRQGGFAERVLERYRNPSAHHV